MSTTTKTSSSPSTSDIQQQRPQQPSPAFAPNEPPSLEYFTKRLKPYKSTITKLPAFFFFLESIVATILYSKRHDPLLRFQFQQLLSINLFFAGLAHFAPDIVNKYKKLIPDFLPYKEFWVYITGVPMIVGAVMLWFEDTRKWAAQLLLATLLFVFPGNLWCLVSKDARKALDAEMIHAILRLPLQLTMAVWCMWFLD